LNYKTIENILEIYSLEEILELNDYTLEDALYYLVENEFVTLPTPEPVDLND